MLYKTMEITPVRWIAMLAMAGGVAVAQDAKADKIIDLPTYTVSDSRVLPPPESWRYVSVSGFEILSNASPKTTEHLVKSFQRFRMALDLVWPDVQRTPAEPTTLIVSAKNRQFDQFQTSEQREKVAKTSLTLRDRQRVAMVLDLQPKFFTTDQVAGDAITLVSDAASTDSNQSGSQQSGDSYRQLYREYIHNLISASEPRPPAWFEEGLSQLFMAMEIGNNYVMVGKLDDPMALRAGPESPAVDSGDPSARAATTAGVSVQDLDFNAVISRGRLMPLDEMLAMGYDSPAMQSSLGSVWGKQCYAFVHWGLYGDDGRHQKAFVTFIARLAKQPLSEELFKSCFKQSYKDMLSTLRSYAQHTDHRVAGVDAEKGQKLPGVPPFEVREATDAEVGRIKGDALFISGNRELGRMTMLAPYIRGERDPRLLASIAFMEQSAGDKVKAEKFFNAAAKAQVVQPRVYLELARSRYAEAIEKPGESDGRFSQPQMAAVLTPLFTARSQKPSMPAVYQLIADTWARSPITPEPDHLGVLDEGVRLFPGNAELVYATAVQKKRAGMKADVALLAEHGLKVAKNDPAMKAKFEALKAP